MPYVPNRVRVGSTGIIRPSILLPRQRNNHPLLQNNKLLALALGHNRMFDFAGGLFGALTGTGQPAVKPRMGASIGILSTGNGDNLFSPKPAITPSQITMAAIGTVAASTANIFIGMSFRTNNLGYRLDTTNAASPILTLTKASVVQISSGIALTPGVPYALVASHDKTTGATYFAARNLLTGRVQIATATNTQNPVASNTGWSIGRAINASANHSIALGLVSLCFLPMKALIDWTADPWGLFEPFALDVNSSQTSGTAYSLNATAGSYLISGAATRTAAQRMLGATTGSYLISGVATRTAAARMLAATAGSYATTGAAARTSVGRMLGAAPGTYTINGAAASLVKNSGGSTYTLSADAGSYAMTGAAASLAAARKLAANAGSYIVTGQAASLVKVNRYILQADAGSYLIAGSGAILEKSGVGPTSTSDIYTWMRRQLRK
jgi:hypothetical protein